MKKTIFSLLFVFLVVCMGCDNDSSTSKDTNTPPSGTDSFDESSLNLPDGINIKTVNGDMTSLYTSIPAPDIAAFSTCLQGCLEAEPVDPNCFMECLNDSGMGTEGGSFNLNLVISNSTPTTIVIEIEAGVIFIPGDDDVQTMIVIQTITITVVPGTQNYIIPVFCINPHKSAPSSEDDDFTEAGETTKPCLQTIIDKLSAIEITDLEYSEISLVQDIIWKCVEDEITQEDWDDLDAIIALH